MKTEQQKQIIEMAQIRLSTEETRAIVRAQVAGKPVAGSPYSGSAHAGLVDLGIMRRVKRDTSKDEQKKAELWERTQTAARQRDMRELKRLISSIESISADKSPEFELTALGKQIARGISVRMGSR